MTDFGDEEYIFNLSNRLLMEKQRIERQNELIKIGGEKVNIHDRKAIIKALVRLLKGVEHT